MLTFLWSLTLNMDLKIYFINLKYYKTTIAIRIKGF
uniref:Uncharacterized protein n=1 Tax=Lepeophtheirus salmonis TaxID=72036 RepID=A0A0K2T3A8_LEPSM